MHPSFYTIFKIFTLRAKPQDIDTSNYLLKALLLPTYILSGVFYKIYLPGEHNFITLYIVAAAMLFLDMFIIYVILQNQQKTERWTQTVCAILGVQLIMLALFLLLRLLIPSIVNNPPSGDAIAIAMIIQLWGFAIMCMIIKEALECSLFISILINIALFFCSQFFFSFLQSQLL